MTNLINSNLDVNSLVSAMLKPKEAKILKTNNEIKTYEAKVSNIGKVKSSINDLKNKLSEINNEEDIDKNIVKIKEFVSMYNDFTMLAKNSRDFNFQSFNSSFRKDLSNLSIGVSFDKNGVILFKESSLDKTKKIEGTLTVLIDENSVITKELNSIKIEYKIELYNNKVSSLSKKNDNEKIKLTDYESQYRRNFNNLQNILLKLESNSNSLNIKG